MMPCKALGCMTGDRFVECVGLFGAFRDLLSADEQGKKKNDIFHAAVG